MRDTYELTNMEQLRALSDRLRQRIINVLIDEAMTVTQVGERLGIAASKVHYHVRELERVGLVQLVETRENRGILEKYYRPVARHFSVPGTLMQSAPLDEPIAFARELLHGVSRDFLSVVSESLRSEPDQGPALSVINGQAWMTRDEFMTLVQQISELLEPFERPRQRPDEREHTIVAIAYTSPPFQDEDDDLHQNGAQSPAPKMRRGFLVGAQHLTRQSLEAFVDRNETVDMMVLGVCSFAEDVTADLVDRVVVRFRQRGALRASDEIRAVLQRKGEKPETSVR